MNKCSPVEMRKNLEVVEQFKRIGIDFVAIPVKNSDHKNEMIQYGNEVFEEMATAIEHPNNDE
jgi:hypothetical protein